MDRDQTLSSENTIPSTPPPAIFSDDAKPTSPPSSPPGFPWDVQDAHKTKPQPPQKSAFSLLGKRKALSAIDDNVRPTKKPATTKKKAEDGALTQMQISLGQKTQTRCKTCGMEYILSSMEDRKLHDKYHKQNTEGYEMGPRFQRTARQAAIFDGLKKGDLIFNVDCRDKETLKKKADAVLDIAQRELGAVEIDIWGSKKQDGADSRCQSYLYVRGTKCIGYLLVERIQKAWEVVAPDKPARTQDETTKTRRSENAASALKKRRQRAEDELRLAESSPIEPSKSATDASLGISRVWTSSSHRRQNVATALLDAALRDHEDNLSSAECGSKGKDEVAFSQPTTSGARLARKWFGKTYGWKVYVD